MSAFDGNNVSVSSEKNAESNISLKKSTQLILHPPTFVVFGQAFDIEMTFAATNNDEKEVQERQQDTTNDKDTSQEFDHIEFEISVAIHNGKSSSQPSFAKVDTIEMPLLMTDPPSPIKFEKEKRVKITCTIKKEKDTSRLIGPFFVLNISTKKKQGNRMKLETLATKPFQLANCKLNIKPVDWDEIWYKDEGGREKCMQATVYLSDHSNNVVKGRSVPLKLTLLYEADQILRVMRQEILHIFGTSKLEIDPETGSASLRFRIEDVSKNHQGQDFKVLVEEEAGGFSGIAPSCTPGVSIRSKRNKRNRSKCDAVGSLGRSPEFNHESIISRSPFATPEESQNGPGIDQRTQPYAFSGNVDVQRLREAMRGVIQWTEEVVNGLYPLQWQVVGYSPLPDGNYDYNNPYHSMPNPNKCIGKILSMYSASTREHLRVLISAVENTQADQVNAGRSPRPTSQLNSQFTARKGTEASSHHKSTSTKHRRTGEDDHPVCDLYSTVYDQQQWSENLFHKTSPPNDVRPFTTNPQGRKERMDRNSHFLPMLSNIPMRQTPMHAIDAQLPSTASVSLPHQNPMLMHHSPPLAVQTNFPSLHHHEGDIDLNDRQAEVFYVLATEYISRRTRDNLGLPAYTNAKELLGFYRESKVKIGGTATFISISKLSHEIGPMEMANATQLLKDHISSSSEAVHALKDWGTIRNLVDHAMVYDWSNGEDRIKETS